MPLAKTHSQKIRHCQKHVVQLGSRKADRETPGSPFHDGNADLRDGAKNENITGRESDFQGVRMLTGGFY